MKIVEPVRELSSTVIQDKSRTGQTCRRLLGHSFLCIEDGFLAKRFKTSSALRHLIILVPQRSGRYTVYGPLVCFFRGAKGREFSRRKDPRAQSHGQSRSDPVPAQEGGFRPHGGGGPHALHVPRYIFGLPIAPRIPGPPILTGRPTS